MTSILLKALRAILVALVGSLNYDRVKELVFGAESSGLSGSAIGSSLRRDRIG